MSALQGYAVFDHLYGAKVPLRASSHFGAGLAAALWDRNEITDSVYDAPNHHTLSLYVSGGTDFVRRFGKTIMPSHGEGSLCLMPRGARCVWGVSGSIQLFHLYISRQAFDHAVAETLGGDPARISLRDETYFRDPVLEGMIRAAILPLNWDEPAERIAVSHAGQSILAYLLARMSERGPRALDAAGGLAPQMLRRVQDFVAAHLAEPLAIADLAACADLSPYHFARAFKRSTGEAPHAFVTRQRIARAKTLLHDAPLADVAAACGFASQSHFTARFREATGVTPKVFRDL
ncbi:AraC family transcriptional regulator [Methylovirgula sp. 4M-Z18]|nr:AraC family transcriptional regulator [Methylovirgula sp. 4M-Z18]